MSVFGVILYIFSCIRTEYGEIRSIFPYSVQMRKTRTRITPNTDTFYAMISESESNVPQQFLQVKKQIVSNKVKPSNERKKSLQKFWLVSKQLEKLPAKRKTKQNKIEREDISIFPHLKTHPCGRTMSFNPSN